LMSTEHRNVRNQWNTEKTELEGKVFQAQSIMTQYQGGARKKEKELALLQDQLAKLARNRGGDTKMGMTLSKPIAKNSTQIKTITVRDAQVIAAEGAMEAALKENMTLRESMAAMEKEVVSLRSGLCEMTSVTNELRSKMMEAEAAAAATASSSSPTALLSPIGGVSASHALIRLLEGAPTARPVAFLSHRITTELDELRAKAEVIRARHDKMQRDSAQEEKEEQEKEKEKEQIIEGNAAANGSCTTPSRSVLVYQTMLDGALELVREQDRLLLRALACKLPYSAEKSKDAASAYSNRRLSQDAKEDGAGANSAGTSPAVPSPLPSLLSPDLLAFLEMEPTSPDTLELLKQAGIMPLDLQKDMVE